MLQGFISLSICLDGMNSLLFPIHLSMDPPNDWMYSTATNLCLCKAIPFLTPSIHALRYIDSDFVLSWDFKIAECSKMQFLRDRYRNWLVLLQNILRCFVVACDLVPDISISQHNAVKLSRMHLKVRWLDDTCTAANAAIIQSPPLRVRLSLKSKLWYQLTIQFIEKRHFRRQVQILSCWIQNKMCCSSLWFNKKVPVSGRESTAIHKFHRILEQTKSALFLSPT